MWSKQKCSSVNSVPFEIVLKDSFIYYLRSVIWVGVLFSIVTGLGYIPDRTIAALRAILCFIILLLILAPIKLYYSKIFDSIRWFCDPGNIFLKSWISLFFYVYLIRVPSDLSSVEAVQIVSWVFQCIFGNFLATIICGCVLSIAFYIVRESLHKAIDADEFDAVEEIRTSQLHRISTLLETTESREEPVKLDLPRLNSKPPDVNNPLHLEDNNHNSSTKPAITDPIEIKPPNQSAKRLSLEVDGTLRDLGASFTVSQFLKKKSLPETTGDILTIERASCIKSEVKVKESPVISSVFPKSPIFNSSEPFTFKEDQILQSSIADMIERKSNNLSTAVALKNVLIHKPVSPKTKSSEFVPSMYELFVCWTTLSFITGFALLVANLTDTKSIHHFVIVCQFCSTIAVFTGCSVLRSYLTLQKFKTLLIIFQSVTIFFPTVLFVVIFSSTQGFENWSDSLLQYLTSLPLAEFQYWGAGDLLVMLLPAAISSLAFSTLDAILQFHKLMPLIVPGIIVSCLAIIIQGAALARLLRSPPETGLTLLNRTITTPIAVSIAELTGASPALTAAATIINGITSYICVPYVMSLFRITNPVTRGCTAAVSGTLLGVLAVDEKGEKIAAGIGIACYGICSVVYAIIMAITGFRDFVVKLD